MNKRTWHKGPPPHVGWWAASICQDVKSWRWWDGKRWSWSVGAGGSSMFAKSIARHNSDYQTKIEWATYYPKNARVPRIDPRKKK